MQNVSWDRLQACTTERRTDPAAMSPVHELQRGAPGTPPQVPNAMPSSPTGFSDGRPHVSAPGTPCVAPQSPLISATAAGVSRHPLQGQDTGTSGVADVNQIGTADAGNGVQHGVQQQQHHQQQILPLQQNSAPN